MVRAHPRMEHDHRREPERPGIRSIANEYKYHHLFALLLLPATLLLFLFLLFSCRMSPAAFSPADQSSNLKSYNSAIEITGDTLTIDDVVNVARNNALSRLSTQSHVITRIQDSVDFLQTKVCLILILSYSVQRQYLFLSINHPLTISILIPLLIA